MDEKTRVLYAAITMTPPYVVEILQQLIVVAEKHHENVRVLRETLEYLYNEYLQGEEGGEIAREALERTKEIK